MKRMLLAIALSIVLASSANAEEAWSLWVYHTTPKWSKWMIGDPQPSFEKCKSLKEALLADYKKMGKKVHGDIVVDPLGKDPESKGRFICYPVNVNPREITPEY